MKIALLLLGTIIGGLLQACGQNRPSSTINKSCQSTLELLGVKLKYPLSVQEAVKTYDLNYWSNGVFYQTLPFGPAAFSHLPYNFKIVFSGDMPFNDVVPAEHYTNRIVKGYEFIFQASVNYDSLKTSIAKNFADKSFVEKERTYAQGFEYMATTYYSTLDILTVSPCVNVVMYKNKRSPLSLTWVIVYFDLTEEDVRHLYF